LGILSLKEFENQSSFADVVIKNQVGCSRHSIIFIYGKKFLLQRAQDVSYFYGIIGSQFLKRNKQAMRNFK